MPGPAVRAIVAPADPVGSDTESFTRSITSFSGFGDIANPDRFVKLPDDWWVGVADVVASTEAIAAGRYKSVNTAGAAVISAVSNALGTLDFPFIFAGDGASFAVSSADAAAACQALTSTLTWVGQALGLSLRGAMLQVSAIRAEGFDVQVARFQASRDVTYAMFSGRGLGWAEQSLKAGRIGLPSAGPDTRPDLSGLSCRFKNIKSKHGVILSMLVRPLLQSEDTRFQSLVVDLLAISEAAPGEARPVPVFGTLGGVDFGSLRHNARLEQSSGASPLTSLVRTLRAYVIATVVLAARIDIGRFSARRYLREVVANSDFRKYDDGLMMTLDCSVATADRLEQRLLKARGEAVAMFGLHRQRSATVTCVVPSASDSRHVHFIDGAAGGYAMAASDLKSRLSEGGNL